MRAPAPPYAGEGPHALWHVSEADSIALWPLWTTVAASTLEFSGMRLRNAEPAPVG